MTVYFVTGHPGAVEWAARRGMKATILSHLEVGIIKGGDVVIGTLPVHLAAAVCDRKARYLHLVMDLPRDGRQRNLTADEMEAFGARIEEFQVSRLSGASHDA